MSVFHDLRSAAGLTISDASQLLGIDVAKIAAYESGELALRPRELQILKGLAKVAPRNPGRHGCESEVGAATTSAASSSVNNARSNSPGKRTLEKPVISGNDRVTETQIASFVGAQSKLGLPIKHKEAAAVRRGRHDCLMTTIRSKPQKVTTIPGRPSYRVLCGDALDLLKGLSTASVDMCMTSPPYWGHREYDVPGIGQEPTYDAYVNRLCDILQEVKRVLKAKGSLWLNIGDSYEAKNLVGIPWRLALRLIDHHSWILRNDVIWNKVKGAPDNSRDKLRNIHEHVFHFVKQKNYFYNADAIRSKPQEARVVNGSIISATGVSGVRYKRQIELSTALTPAEKIEALRALNTMLDDVRARRLADFRMIIRGQQRTTHSDRDKVSGRAKEIRNKGFYFLKYHPNGSKPSDVWDILPEDTQKRETHFAPYPADLCRMPILATCPVSGMVLDPFCGTGTTLAVAKEVGRSGIGIDISPNYADITRQRLADLLTDIS
jgi:DNA modification methylase/transcriptional regulator with XRE-family HTH domain